MSEASSKPHPRSGPAAGDARAWQDFLAASKKKKGPIYTRYVNRNAAIPFTYVFWRLGVHPNAVSAISFAVTHSALLLLVFAQTSIAVVVAAWFLLALGYVLDSCDGQLARVSGKTSRLGEWLDHSLDMVKILNFNMVLAYVMISHAVTAGEPLVLPLLAAFMNLLSQPAHFFVLNLKDAVLSKGGNEPPAAGGRWRPFMHVADFGLLILIVLLLPRMDWFVPVYFAYGACFLLLFIAHFAITVRRIARL